jgi:predicted O-methyltransferase YrrM
MTLCDPIFAPRLEILMTTLTSTQASTLTSKPLAPLLDRLFAEADESSPMRRAALHDLSAEEIARLRASKTAYLDFYGRMKDVPLPVSRATGTLLYMLARGAKARNIVEFGTSFGISTLHLAAALRDNGGGRLITTEFEPSKITRARENLTAGGVIDLVEIRAGDALQTLKTGLPDAIDLVLMDGAKPLYPEILALIEARLRPGAFIVADDADASPEYLARVRSTAHGYLSTPFGDDVEVSMRLS